MSSIDDAAKDSYESVDKAASDLKGMSKKGSNFMSTKAKASIKKGGMRLVKSGAKKAGGALLRAGSKGLLVFGKFLLIVFAVVFGLIILESLLAELEYEFKPQNKMYTNNMDNEYRVDSVGTMQSSSSSSSTNGNARMRSLLSRNSSDNGNYTEQTLGKDAKVILSEENQAVENYHYYNSTKSMLDNKYYIPLKGIDINKNPQEMMQELLDKDAIEFEGEYKFIKESSLKEVEKNWIDGYGVPKGNFTWTTDISKLNKKINNAGSIKGFKSKYIGELTKIEDERLKIDIKDPYNREEYFKVPEELLSRLNSVVYNGEFLYDQPFLNPVKFRYKKEETSNVSDNEVEESEESNQSERTGEKETAESSVKKARATVESTDTTTNSNSNEDVIKKVLDVARQQIGKPYLWGGKGPNAFDCSGLTSWAYLHGANYKLPAGTVGQKNHGKLIKNMSDLKPGDLVFFDNPSNPGTVKHVGIVEAGYVMIHAPRTGKNIERADLQSNYWKSHFLWARRIFESNNLVAGLSGGTIEDLENTVIETKKKFRAIPRYDFNLDTEGIKTSANKVKYGLGSAFVYKPVIEFELERGVRINQTAVKKGEQKEEGSEDKVPYYEPVVTAEAVNNAQASVMYVLDKVITFYGVYNFEYDLSVEEVSSTDIWEEGEIEYKTKDGGTFNEVRREEVKKIAFKEKPSGVYLQSKNEEYINAYLGEFEGAIPSSIYNNFDMTKLINSFKGNKSIVGTSQNTTATESTDGDSEVSRVEELRDVATEVGKEYGIDPNWLLAIAYNESKGDLHLSKVYDSIKPKTYWGVLQMGGANVNAGTHNTKDYDVHDFIDLTQHKLTGIVGTDDRLPKCPANGPHDDEEHYRAAKLQMEYFAKRSGDEMSYFLGKYFNKDPHKDNITPEEISICMFYASGAYNSGRGGQKKIIESYNGDIRTLYDYPGDNYRQAAIKANRSKEKQEYIRKVHEDYPRFSGGIPASKAGESKDWDPKLWYKKGNYSQGDISSESIGTGTNGQSMNMNTVLEYKKIENMEDSKYRGKNTVRRELIRDEINMILNGAISMMYSQDMSESEVSKDAYWKDGFDRKYFEEGMPKISPPGYYMEDVNWKFKIADDSFDGNINSILTLAERYGSQVYDIAKTAVNQIGKDYKAGASGPMEFDSESLVWYIFNYAREKQLFAIDTIEKYHEKFQEVVKEDDLRPGDVSFFTTKGSTDNKPNDVAVYLGNDAAIYADKVSGKIELVQYSEFKIDESRTLIDTRRIIKFNSATNNSNSSGSIEVSPGDIVTGPLIPGKTIICVDAGHGNKTSSSGRDANGAVGVTGTKEEVIAFDVAKRVVAGLQSKGYNVIVTRSGTDAPGLGTRTKIANNANADIFVSIHFNSGSAKAEGLETLYPFDFKGSKKAAEAVQKAIIRSTGSKDRGIKLRGDLWVLNGTKMTSILVEGPFLSNAKDEALAKDPAWRQKFADGIIEGIDNYCGNP